MLEACRVEAIRAQRQRVQEHVHRLPQLVRRLVQRQHVGLCQRLQLLQYLQLLQRKVPPPFLLILPPLGHWSSSATHSAPTPVSRVTCVGTGMLVLDDFWCGSMRYSQVLILEVLLIL